NPFHYIDHSSMESISNHFLGNVYIEYNPVQSVVIRSTFGIDNAMTKSNLFLPANTPSGIQTQGCGEVVSSLHFNCLNENHITITPNLSEQHNLTILGGFSAQKNHFEDVQAISYGFANGSTGFNNLGAGENPQPPSSFASEYSFLSYFSRVNYSLMDRYLLTA